MILTNKNLRWLIFSTCLIGTGAVSLNAAPASDNAPYGAGTVEVVGTTLEIDGTSLDDHASVVSISGNRFLVVLNGKTYKPSADGVTGIEFSGEEGNDYLTNRTNYNVVGIGGAGDDFLKTTQGTGMFYGGTGDDLLIGGPGDDLLCGGSDNDTIIGNAGDDTISGDAIAGGSGGSVGGGAGDVEAELVGTSGFARGQFVQVGINEQGTFGGDLADLPSGFVDVAADGRGRNGLFGFIADTGLDGFAGGDYDGDFFVPGTPEEGFTVAIEGTNYSNNTDGEFDIPGMITSSATGETADVNWNGTINGLGVSRKVSIFENGLFIRLEVTLTNSSGGSLNDIYFMNNVDPDNDQTIHGSFSTLNTIVSQGDSDPDNVSLVTAEQNATGPGVSGGTEELGSALSLVSFDPRARVSFGGFGNRLAQAVYDGTGVLTGTVGAFETRDEAISLAFNVGTLANGESTTLVYYYSLEPNPNDLTGITDTENACADSGEPGDDIVYGGTGNDDIVTDEGADIVYAGSGNDSVDTGDGDDRAYGQSGNDTIESGAGDDEVHGGVGNDRLVTLGGNDRVFGNAGRDLIYAGVGDDHVNGGGHDDKLYGMAGNDHIVGAGGDDYMNGGAGADTYNGGSGVNTEVN